MKKFLFLGWIAFAVLGAEPAGIVAPPPSSFTLLASVSAGSSDGDSVTTGSIDTTGADLLVLIASVDWAVSTPTISDSKGNTWTRIVQGTSSGALRCDIWYSIPTSVGSGHTFTQSDTSSFGAIAVSAYSGSNASPVDQSNTGDGNAGANSIQVNGVTPTQDNELVITGLAAGTAGTGYSIDESLTKDASVNGAAAQHYGVAIASIIQTTATLKDPTWTVTNNTQLAAAIATFKVPATASGAWFLFFKRGWL